MLSYITSVMSGSAVAKRYATVLLLALFIIIWSVVIYTVDVTAMVASLGVTNSYVFVFLIAIMGAFSSFTTVSIYPALVTLALTELSPYMLGLIAGIGLTFGDIFFYYFGSKARSLTSDSLRYKLDNFLIWLEKKPEWLVHFLVYLYIGFTPLPNNIFTGSLAFSGYPLRKLILAIFFGNVTLTLLIAYLAKRGIEVFLI